MDYIRAFDEAIPFFAGVRPANFFATNQPGDGVDSTLKYYQDNAGRYQEHNRTWDMSPVYAMFLRHFCGQTLLDVGCGTGRDAKFFSGVGKNVTGIDGSEEMLKLARDECPAADFHCVDFSRDFVLAKDFDGMWACASLLHLTDAQFAHALVNLRRFLAPGGAMYLGLKKAEAKAPPDDGRYFNYWTGEKLAPVLLAGGFAVLEQHVEETPRISWLNTVVKSV